MARSAQDYDTKSKTARLRLAVREKSYNRQAGAKRLGYIRKDGRNGTWLAIESVPGTKRERTRVIAQADDFSRADGVEVLTFEQAMEKAAAAGELRPRGHLTVLQAIDRYYDILAAEKKHAEEYRRAIKGYVPDALGSTRVDRLSTTQLKEWQAKLVLQADPKNPEAKTRSKSTVNRILGMLKAPLNAAFQDEKNGIPSSAAWDRVTPFEGADQAREDDLEPAQILVLIAKAASFSQALANLIEATYLIGCRAPGELAGVEVRHFEPANHQLRIPSGKTGARDVTLTNEAVAFFSRLAKDKLPNAPLLPRADGTPWGRTGHWEPMHRAVRLAGLPETVCLYTLRHAHISRAIEAGRPLSLIADNCGTSLLMIQRNYAKVLARTRKDVIQKTATNLRVVA
jgi:integrase